MDPQLKIELFILLILLYVARVTYLIWKITAGCNKFATKKRDTPCSTLICIGSGGHTTEMLKLMEDLDFEKYSPRYYLMANSDATSEAKIEDLEEQKDVGEYKIYYIPRSRMVGQSYITSIYTTIKSSLICLPYLGFLRPELILCNGPGTCIPVCLCAFLFNSLSILSIRIVFIESFCRTKTFSLTGKILIYIADNILVQWPSLKRKLKRADYIGQLL